MPSKFSWLLCAMGRILTYTSLTTQPGHAAAQSGRDVMHGVGSLVAIHNIGKDFCPSCAALAIFPQMLQIFKLLLQYPKIDEV